MQAEAVDHQDKAVARVDDAVHRQQQGTADDHEGPDLEKVIVGERRIGHPDLEPTGQQPSEPAKGLTVSGSIEVSNLPGAPEALFTRMLDKRVICKGRERE